MTEPRAAGPSGRAMRRAASRRRQARRSVLLARTLTCTLALAVVSGSGGVWAAYRNVTNGMITSQALDAVRHSAPPRLDKAVNVLLIGLDSRKDMNGNDLPGQFVQDELHAGSSSDVGGYNTNTLMVLHIPPDGGKVTALSIPRDDYVQTYGADGRMHKIKEAYGIAKAAAVTKLSGKGLSKAQVEQQSREVGREATLATVQKFLGVPIDHFAEVNLVGFYDIAKAVGPIQVCLNKATKDPAMEGQGSGADFQAGINTLDASQALSFVRQRHNLTNGDLDRTKRQQAFLASVGYKLKSEGVLGDLGKLGALLDVVKKDVVIDNQWDILDFAQQAPNLMGGNVEFNTLPITGFKTVNGESVNTVDQQQIQQTVRQLFTDKAAPAPQPSGTASPSGGASAAAPGRTGSGTVDVYNASPVAGAAAKESHALAGLGYHAGAVGNARTKSGTTTVTYGVGAEAGAAGVAARYGVSASPSSSVPAGHIVVTLGTGFRAPAADAGGAAPAAPDKPSAAPSAQAPRMQGAPVTMGGIPCVN
ncbi:LCP family protein [Kitasatospora mediocidica]|uniref:LCP family protein n=1 Tax=Kitasatospora mediocidica TaxID=58352 RepID=UPI0007C73340|nr:LCP family protein [Kitasatospora mediocidica]